MRNEAESKNMMVESVNIMDLEMKPCIGCMACRTKEKCVLPEDDTVRVLEKLRWADAIILGAPCYWGNIPGQMKVLFDRLGYGMMREICHYAGFKIVKEIERGGTMIKPQLTEKDKQKCRKAIAKLK